MLTLALAATLVGFVLLVLGLVTGHVALAIACIVICLIGVAFLITDIVTSGRRGSDRSLSDLVGSADGDDPESADAADTRVDDSPRADVADDPRAFGGFGIPRPTGASTEALDVSRSDQAPTTSGAPSVQVPSMSPTWEPAQQPPAPADRGFDDYLRAVGAPTPAPGADLPNPAPDQPYQGRHEGRHEAHRHEAHRHEGHRASGPRHGARDDSADAETGQWRSDDQGPLDPGWRSPTER